MLIAIAPHASVIIWSISGQQIAKYNFENEKDLAFDFDAAPGPYIAEVKIGNDASVFLQFVNK